MDGDMSQPCLMDVNSSERPANVYAIADDLELEPDQQQTTFCPGIPLDWPRLDFFHSYPFQRHDNSMFGFIGYKFCAVDADGSSFRIRSYRCAGTVSVDGDQSCTECLALTDKVKHLGQMSNEALPHTSYMYRSHSQLHQVTDGLHDDLSRLHCVVMLLYQCQLEHSLNQIIIMTGTQPWPTCGFSAQETR